MKFKFSLLFVLFFAWSFSANSQIIFDKTNYDFEELFASSERFVDFKITNNGKKIFVYSAGLQISELNLTDSSIGAFYKEQKTLSLKVVNDGYIDSQTGIITMNPEKACFVEIKLSKK